MIVDSMLNFNDKVQETSGGETRLTPYSGLEKCICPYLIYSLRVNNHFNII